MNKKIIAAAIAAAVAVPAASAATANVTVYGKVHMDIVKNNRDNVNNSAVPAAEQDADNVAVNDNSSRLGFKGHEDLGNGLKAIWQYEMSYDVDEGGAIGGARNSFLGLSGGFGTFLVGRHDTPAKVAFYAAGNERLGDSIIDLNGAFGFEEARIDDAIAYVSPNFSGFTFAAAIVPGEQNDNAATPNNDEANSLADGWSLAAIYKGHGFKAGLGYSDVGSLVEGLNNPTNGTGVGLGSVDATLLNAGMSYSMKPFSVGVQYQKVAVEAGSPKALDADKTSWALTGSFAFGNNKVHAIYGQSDIDNLGNAADVDSDSIGLALQHTMSKRTSVYVAYQNSDVDRDSSVTWSGGTIGGIWRIAGTAGNGGVVTDGNSFAVGMIHSF